MRERARANETCEEQPFALGALDCSLGLMITASHNRTFLLRALTLYPKYHADLNMDTAKDDNGYKLYWSNGVQIVPPHDAGIAAEIEKSLEVSEEAWTVPPEVGFWKGTEEMKAKYVELTKSLCSQPESAKFLLPLRNPAGIDLVPNI